VLVEQRFVCYNYLNSIQNGVKTLKYNFPQMQGKFKGEQTKMKLGIVEPLPCFRFFANTHIAK
jgi:hypothetical protein